MLIRECCPFITDAREVTDVVAIDHTAECAGCDGAIARVIEDPVRHRDCADECLGGNAGRASDGGWEGRECVIAGVCPGDGGPHNGHRLVGTHVFVCERCARGYGSQYVPRNAVIAKFQRGNAGAVIHAATGRDCRSDGALGDAGCGHCGAGQRVIRGICAGQGQPCDRHRFGGAHVFVTEGGCAAFAGDGVSADDSGHCILGNDGVCRAVINSRTDRGIACEDPGRDVRRGK